MNFLEQSLNGFSVFVIILIVFSLWVGFKLITIVEQGREYTVLRLGRYHRTLDPGFHLVIPFWERVGHKINMKERVLDVPRQEVITKDNALVTVDGVVFFQVINAAKAAYAVDDLELAILNLSTTNLRTVMGSMTLDDLFSERDTINVRLLSTIDKATDPWGVKVTRVEVKDISPPQDLVAAMAQQKKADQLNARKSLKPKASASRKSCVPKDRNRRKSSKHKAKKKPLFSKLKRAKGLRKRKHVPPRWSRNPLPKAIYTPSSISWRRNT